MVKEDNYKLPELNRFQINEIIKHLKKGSGTNRKNDMDEIARQIAEILMLSGFNNGESSYILTNVQRHLISTEKNRQKLQPLIGHMDINDLDIKTLTVIQNAFAGSYRSGVDDDGNRTS